MLLSQERVGTLIHLGVPTATPRAHQGAWNMADTQKFFLLTGILRNPIHQGVIKMFLDLTVSLGEVYCDNFGGVNAHCKSQSFVLNLGTG